MGYACPVCEIPQADARHLANHLAFTAMLGDDDHEAWLDEHTPDWADAGEDALADRVAEHAESASFPQVFEDTTGHDHRDGDDPRPGELFEEDDARTRETRGPSTRGDEDIDSETAAVVEEAREMTRRANQDEANPDAADGDTAVDTVDDDDTTDDGDLTDGDEGDDTANGDDPADEDENG